MGRAQWGHRGWGGRGRAALLGVRVPGCPIKERHGPTPRVLSTESHSWGPPATPDSGSQESCIIPQACVSAHRWAGEWTDVPMVRPEPRPRFTVLPLCSWGPGWGQGAPTCFQDNRATVAVRMEGAGRRVSTRKDIVAEPDDVIELQSDVSLVWDAHVIHERLPGGNGALSQGTWGRETPGPSVLLGRAHQRHAPKGQQVRWLEGGPRRGAHPAPRDRDTALEHRARDTLVKQMHRASCQPQRPRPLGGGPQTCGVALCKAARVVQAPWGWNGSSDGGAEGRGVSGGRLQQRPRPPAGGTQRGTRWVVLSHWWRQGGPEGAVGPPAQDGGSQTSWLGGGAGSSLAGGRLVVCFLTETASRAGNQTQKE